MNTSSVELGSLLSLASREHAQSLTRKGDVGKAQERPAASAASVATNAATKSAQHDAPAQRAQLNEALERVSRLDQRLSFRVDEGSGKSVVVVSDARTSEVLKQFPSEEMLNVARRLEEHLQQSGDMAGVLHTDEA